MKPSQADRILVALKAGDRLTPLDALRRFGCFRLGARIYDLRDAGYDVQTETVRMSSGARVARYYLPCAGQANLW